MTAVDISPEAVQTHVFAYSLDKAHPTRQLIDALRSALTAREWQPLETAPKDGTEVLVHIGQGLVRVAFVDNANGGGWVVWPGRHAVSPTHWMPLPEAPK